MVREIAAKFTPAPGNAQMHEIGGNERMICPECSAEMRERDEHFPDCEETKQANAQLRAAAPEMYGQLETAIAALKMAAQECKDGRPNEAAAYVRGVIAGNELALAKARGEGNR
jgi:hypothetical protein